MPTVVVATDSDAVADEVDAALGGPDVRVVRVREGAHVEDAVRQTTPDLVVLDLQIGNMGGMAVCMHLRHEGAKARLADATVLMLLDRSADTFLARRSGADGWMIKPLDSFRLRRAYMALVEGDGTYEESPNVETVRPA